MKDLQIKTRALSSLLKDINKGKFRLIIDTNNYI